MKTLLLQIYLCMQCVQISYAQWQTDVRLTNNPAQSRTYSNNAWCVAANGNVVHVLWQDLRDGNEEIYYKRSSDEGTSWGNDTRLTNNTASSFYPSVATSGAVVHVVWQDDRDGNMEIYYKRSTDEGLSWGNDTRLTNNVAVSEHPSLTVTGSVVHLVWSDSRTGNGNYEIFYNQSTDGGTSWGTDTALTSNSALSFYPSVAVSGSIVHVAWEDNRDGNEEIYYKRSTDEGLSWAIDTRLTNATSISGNPTISVLGSDVHVVWRDQRDGNDELYYKNSEDGGINWGTDIRLTNDPAFSLYPSIALCGSVVHVVWSDGRDLNEEIYYKSSTDAGVSWRTDVRLTNNTDVSEHPSVTVSGSALHVVWGDNRDANFEIYYKRNPACNTVGINEFPSSPSQFSVYPNPAKYLILISWQVEEDRTAELIIIDVMGKEIMKTVVASDGSMVDVSGFANGIYFVQLNLRNKTITQKIVKY